MKTKKMPYLDRTLDKEVPELKPYLRPGAQVLDVGCGPGTITLDVADTVKPGEVVGIDLEEGMIRKARELAAERNLSNASFKVMDTHVLDFPDQTFDVVYSHTALHGFRDPVRALEEQKRVAKTGGWVIAAGVRDWGLVPRYPPTPTWDKVYEAQVCYADFRRGQPYSDGITILNGGHPQAARRLPEWFIEAGLEDLKVEVKVYRVQYPGADGTEPHPIDLLPYGEDDEYGWYAGFDKAYEAMIADGFIDQETLKQATEEAKAWYNDPRTFHFWVMVLAAGRA